MEKQEMQYDEELMLSLFQSGEEKKMQQALEIAKVGFQKNKAAYTLIVDVMKQKDNSTLSHYAMNLFFECINDFIHFMARKYFNTYITTGSYQKNKDNMQSMENSVMAVLLPKINKYDPNKTTPTTFIKPYVLEGLKTWVQEQSEIKASTNSKIMRIKRAKNQLRAQGKEITYENLHALLPNFTITQIQKLLEIKKMEDTMGNLSSEEALNASNYMSPEQEVIKNEEMNALYDAIEKLPEDERIIFCTAYYIDLKNRVILNSEIVEGKESKGYANLSEMKTTDVCRKLNMKPDVVSRLKRSAKNNIIKILNNQDVNIKRSKMDERSRNILNEGTISFSSSKEDDDMKMYIDSIIDIKFD